MLLHTAECTVPPANSMGTVNGGKDLGELGRHMAVFAHAQLTWGCQQSRGGDDDGKVETPRTRRFVAERARSHKAGIRFSYDAELVR